MQNKSKYNIVTSTYRNNADDSSEETNGTYTPCQDPPTRFFVYFQIESHHYCVEYCHLNKPQ